jgi:hypothetical protein
MNLIPVKAAPGLKVPKESEPRKYITVDKPVQVVGSHYYRKAINDGDLIQLTEKEWEDHKAARDKAEAEAVAAAKAEVARAAKAAAAKA